MSFSILYPEGGDVVTNLFSISVYINAFAKKLGLLSLDVDPQGLTQIAAALQRPDFPHIDGLEQASPFKKAANFFVWFVASRPILQDLPEEIIGKELASIPNHQNVIFAYHMAVDSLHGATIQHKGGTTVTLENRIKVSRHFFCDFVDTFSTAVPVHHFKVVSLLFEQLAYKDNRSASYEESI